MNGSGLAVAMKVASLLAEMNVMAVNTFSLPTLICAMLMHAW